MTTLELVRRTDFTEKAELLQIYSDSYCTVIDGDYLYLIENTQINPQKIIAKIDVKENCKVFDRDKANVFIDWSNMHFGNKDNIEDLPEETIEQYIIEFLAEDINELITFNQKDFSYIESLLRHFDVDTQDKIHKAFKTLNINESLMFTEAYSFSQIDYLVEKQYYYICLNLSKKRYAVSSSNFKKYYTNGACGNWSKLIKKDDFKVIFFNKSDAGSYLNKETEELLRKDLEQNKAPAIITRLLKIEDKLTKSLNEMISTLATSHGIIKIDTISYPDIKDILEPLEALLEKYQHSTTKADKLELFSLLKEKYSYIYSEFSKAQESLKGLYNSYKSINKEIVNG